MKINLLYDENKKIKGYILIPLNEKTAVEITEEEFKKIKKELRKQLNEE